MKFDLKRNIPVILLTVLAPYLFFVGASIGQAIIAASLAGLAGYKYYLEQKELPNYEKMFQEKLENMGKLSDENFKKVEGEIIAIKQKIGVEGYIKTQKGKLSEVKDASSIW